MSNVSGFWCSLSDLNRYAFAVVFETTLSAYSSKRAYARHDDGLTEVNTMTKPKCVDFKICGDFALSAGASERSYHYERC